MDEAEAVGLWLNLVDSGWSTRQAGMQFGSERGWGRLVIPE